MTTQNLLTEWLEIYQKEHIKARTYSRYQGLITMHIVPLLGERNITELGRREIQEFLTQQKKDGNMRNGEKLSATSTNMHTEPGISRGFQRRTWLFMRG